MVSMLGFDATLCMMLVLAQPGPMPVAPALPARIPNVEPLPSLANTSNQPMITLAAVLESVERNYPLLRSIEEERTITGGRFLTAMGAFDTNLRASSNNFVPGSTYESYRFNVGVDQAFANSGMRLTSGYRGGFGDFPSYAGGSKTADGGEFRTGILTPFLRDREIDRPRATLQQAQLNVQAAEPTIDRARIDYQRAATRSYWSWVASGLRVKLATTLLDLARERDIQIEALLKRGVSSRVDRIDNQQNVAARGALLAEAQRLFQQASVDLSLFLRSDDRKPIIGGLEALPEMFPNPPKPDLKQLEDAVARALMQRPEITRLELQRQTVAVDLRLAQNQVLPQVNGFINVAQDAGYTKPSTSTLDRTSLEAGVEFVLPAQRRDARGRIMTFMAQLRQLELQQQFASDTVRAEVQSTLASLERAYEQVVQGQLRVKLAKEVAEVERNRFKEGDSDVLRVTLREQASFEAEVTLLSAYFEYFRLLGEYRAALGER
jgi:outer membrane protein TolC